MTDMRKNFNCILGANNVEQWRQEMNLTKKIIKPA
jgi:hypothetical protein